jgi:hypothetical protein
LEKVVKGDAAKHNQDEQQSDEEPAAREEFEVG